MRMFREVFFDEFHRRPSPEEMLSPIQDVVFDHRGEYYAAVPLKFGKGDQQKVNKARYIANIMFALETRGFVTLISRAARAHEGEEPPKRTRLERMTGKRGWADLSAFARVQLKAQGSEFADAKDFRIYKFAKGKWPQIALRTVVSAHQEEASFLIQNPEARKRSKTLDRGSVLKAIVRTSPNKLDLRLNPPPNLPQIEGPRPTRSGGPNDESAGTDHPSSEQSAHDPHDQTADPGHKTQDKSNAGRDPGDQQNLDQEGINQDPPNDKGDQCSPILQQSNGPADSNSAREDIRYNGEQTEVGDNGGSGHKTDT
jgi:hypothetical protein